MSTGSNVVSLAEWRSARALDRDRASSRVRAVKPADHRESQALGSQDWGRMQANLAAFAFRRTGRRSMEHAEDLAQDAITKFLARPEGWDPAKEPLLKHLSKRVIGLASNEWSRKRSTLEVAMETREDEAMMVAGDDDPTDEVLDRRRLAAQFRARLEARLAGDENALAIVVLMTEGIDSPAGLHEASGAHVRARSARRAGAFSTTRGSSPSRRSSGRSSTPGTTKTTRTRRSHDDPQARRRGAVARDQGSGSRRRPRRDRGDVGRGARQVPRRPAGGGDPKGIRERRSRPRRAPPRAKPGVAERGRREARGVPAPTPRSGAEARPCRDPGALLTRLDAYARRDPRFAAPVAVLFQKKAPEACTDEELQALLEAIDLLAQDRESSDRSLMPRVRPPRRALASPFRNGSRTRSAGGGLEREMRRSSSGPGEPARSGS